MIKLRLASNENRLRFCGYSFDEEKVIYDEQLKDVLANPRWYLDNYETLHPYQVRWANKKSKTPTIPYEFVEKKKRFIKE